MLNLVAHCFILYICTELFQVTRQRQKHSLVVVVTVTMEMHF